MKSRITVEIDFSNGNEPIIQVLSRNSDDVRDQLIKAFYQKLSGSSWCKIVFAQDNYDPTLAPDDERNFKRIIITPITVPDLKKEAEIMIEQHRLHEEWLSRHEKDMAFGK